MECLGCGKVWYQWPDRNFAVRRAGPLNFAKSEMPGNRAISQDMSSTSDEADYDLVRATRAPGTRPEVARILEEELIDSSEIEKIKSGAGRIPNARDPGDASRERSLAKEQDFPHRSRQSNQSAVRRPRSGRTRGESFWHGYFPVLLLIIFLGLVHFSLPIAGKLFEEVAPYAQAYERVVDAALAYIVDLFGG